MCSSSTFISHMDNTYFFFLPIFSSGFWQRSYISRWGHYGSKIMGVLLVPLSEVSGPTIDILWRYRPLLYEGLCPIYFSKELGSSGSIFVL
jgi:hypothetical protein